MTMINPVVFNPQWERKKIFFSLPTQKRAYCFLNSFLLGLSPTNSNSLKLKDKKNPHCFFFYYEKYTCFSKSTNIWIKRRFDSKVEKLNNLLQPFTNNSDGSVIKNLRCCTDKTYFYRLFRLVGKTPQWLTHIS